MIDMRVIFWVAVALTASSGLAATVLVSLRNPSAARARVGSGLGQA